MKLFNNKNSIFGPVIKKYLTIGTVVKDNNINSTVRCNEGIIIDVLLRDKSDKIPVIWIYFNRYMNSEDFILKYYTKTQYLNLEILEDPITIHSVKQYNTTELKQFLSSLDCD